MVKLTSTNQPIWALLWAFFCLVAPSAWAQTPGEMSREAPDFNPKSPLDEDPENSLFSNQSAQKAAPIVRAPDDPRKLDFSIGYSTGIPQFNRVYGYLLIPLPKSQGTNHYRIGMGLGRFLGKTIDSIELPVDVSLNEKTRLALVPGLLFNRVADQLGTQCEADLSRDLTQHFSITTGVGYRQSGLYFTVGAQIAFSKLL